MRVNQYLQNQFACVLVLLICIEVRDSYLLLYRMTWSFLQLKFFIRKYLQRDVKKILTIIWLLFEIITTLIPSVLIQSWNKVRCTYIAVIFLAYSVLSFLPYQKVIIKTKNCFHSWRWSKYDNRDIFKLSSILWKFKQPMIFKFGIHAQMFAEIQKHILDLQKHVSPLIVNAKVKDLLMMKKIAS